MSDIMVAVMVPSVAPTPTTCTAHGHPLLEKAMETGAWVLICNWGEERKSGMRQMKERWAIHSSWPMIHGCARSTAERRNCNEDCAL